MNRFILAAIVTSVAPFCATMAQHEKTKSPIDYTKKKKEKIQFGTASFYANKFNGRHTANGEIFNQEKLTAASNTLALNTWVRVTNLHNKKKVVVKINDRMHFRNKRLIDLSHAAAKRLGYTGWGLARVKVEVLGKKQPDREFAKEK